MGQAKFEVKNFSEFFPLSSTLDSELFLGEGVQDQTFLGSYQRNFGHAKGIFPLLSALDSELFFLGGGWGLWVWAQFFLGQAKFEVNFFLEFFPLSSTLDSEFFFGGIQNPTIFGHTKGILVIPKEFFPLLSDLDSEFFLGGGGLGV